MASHVAASAFGHCLAMVADDEVATRLAIVAARRGGRSLAAALGHARHQSLAHLAANPVPPAVLGPESSPSEVAWALAGTRPAVERAIVDLAGRYRLSRAGFGKALRLAPSVAASRLAAIHHAWAAELDPALLAWLGPGDCEQLAETLGGRPRAATEDLLALTGEVAHHTAACAPCGDRQRAMASVRLLVTAAPLPSPPPRVVAAASGSRLQPPVPAPPLEPHPARLARRALAAVAVVLATAGVAGVVVVDGGSGSYNREASLRALTQLPASAGSLQLSPSTLVLPAGEVSLTNVSAGTVAWEASTDVAWLEVSPRRGRFRPGETTVLRLAGSPPEGDVRASLHVSGDDGSAVAARVDGTVERPPDLQASADGCRVTAVAEDEGDVAVTLHWRGNGGEHNADMAASDTGAVATLPGGTGPVTWWVTAVDGRGNRARTPDATAPDGC